MVITTINPNEFVVINQLNAILGAPDPRNATARICQAFRNVAALDALNE